ncbi:hypothetical protein [Streptomyces sp. NRRL F-4428]|uniref:hypothetical protein n=1 Tax=Streptomyces sp. NRRL F-4428 TaxID=1609137 RepID=UPI000AD65DC8|nr:hypothetical protein [Streptomyces sp. NRRL F-4428]
MFDGFSPGVGFGDGGVITDTELGLAPEAHDPHLDVDPSPLRSDGPPAPDGYGQAA